ncbi:MAG: ribosome-associated translation inhibitor RaiA [Oscillospiraceae bacterium]|nr:ribosome-associated translation inhibitor RaiA [Oscillospiraceae bacterium]
MKIKITGKELKATEAISEYAEKKLKRLEKYFNGENEEIEAFVTIKTEGNQKIAEITVKVKSNTYRTEVASHDLYASIDKNIDILEAQVRKHKTKRERTNNESIRTVGIIEQPYAIENEIIKTIYYDIKPMTPEDAKLRLQEKEKIGDKFYTFINLENSKVNVIFKLKDGKNYGLVEPEA